MNAIGILIFETKSANPDRENLFFFSSSERSKVAVILGKIRLCGVYRSVIFNKLFLSKC